ncbi:MAG: acyltransferase family protein [Bacteroidia bacterium]
MKVDQLTFTRFAAAIIVVIFHYGLKSAPFNNGILHDFMNQGGDAVSYFFCLSGYILAQVYYEGDSTALSKRTFFIKRFARIYPLYFLGFAAALITGLITAGVLPMGYSIILQMLGLHAWVPGIMLEINYPAWSVSVELLFYACFPFLLSLFAKRSGRYIINFTLAIWTISTIIFILLVPNLREEAMIEFTLFFPLLHLNAFIFGVAANIILKRRFSTIRVSPTISTLVFSAAIILLFFIMGTYNVLVPFLHNGLLAPIFMLMIISLHVNTGFLSRIFSLRPLVFLGEISYGIYVLQHPVRMWFEQIIVKYGLELTETFKFYSFVIVLVFAASVAYFFIERPCRRWITERIGEK